MHVDRLLRKHRAVLMTPFTSVPGGLLWLYNTPNSDFRSLPSYIVPLIHLGRLGPTWKGVPPLT